MYGFVARVTKRGVAYVTDQCGQSYVALHDAVQEDAVGRRHLIENEDVDFESAPNERNPYMPLAVSIVPTNREPIDVNTWRETAALTSWNGKSGRALRESGDQLWVIAEEITSLGEETLKVGSQLYCGVAPPIRTGQSWRAVEIEICNEEVATDVQQDSATA